MNRWSLIGRGFCTLPGKIKRRNFQYPPYWSVDRLQEGLLSGRLMKGILKVSAFDTDKAIVYPESSAEGLSPVPSFFARNGAFSGDLVFYDKQDKIVVGVSEKGQQRILVKIIPGDLKVQPRDHRLPPLYLKSPWTPELTTVSSGEDITADSEQSTEPGYLGVVRRLEISSNNAEAELIRVIGREGDFNGPEWDALLEFYGLDSSDHYDVFDDSVLVDIPREDHRDLCVFSIDPPSAKDLDDAISVCRTKDDQVEIGVHVADVTAYLPRGSFLDKKARERATTVYLPNRVYPMLPRSLSEGTCSLLPGNDRLAFSVFFTLKGQDFDSEKLPSVRFARTLIKSRAKLNYQQVDDYLGGIRVVDNLQNSAEPIWSDIEFLEKIARARRFERLKGKGVALKQRDAPEFIWDKGLPVGLKSEALNSEDNNFSENKPLPSHFIIEELMVMANQAVAERLLDWTGEEISRSFPKMAVLRIHPEAVESRARLIEGLYALGENELAKETEQIDQISEILSLCENRLSEARYLTVTNSLLKDFKAAKYVAGSLEKKEIGNISEISNVENSEHSHWGLGLSSYLHFTSPIRRYADVIAHRLLSAALNGGSLNEAVGSVDELSKMLSHCNRNKRHAEDAEKDALNLCVALVLRQQKSITVKDAVITKLLLANNDLNGRTLKDAVEVFIPILSQSKSVSLEFLGLQLVEQGETATIKVISDGSLLYWKVGQEISLQIVLANPERKQTIVPHWTIAL